MRPIREFVMWWQYEKQGTIRDLALQLDITTATIYYWLRGAPVPVKYLKRLSEISNNLFPRERIRLDLFGNQGQVLKPNPINVPEDDMV